MIAIATTGAEQMAKTGILVPASSGEQGDAKTFANRKHNRPRKRSRFRTCRNTGRTGKSWYGWVGTTDARLSVDKINVFCLDERCLRWCFVLMQLHEHLGIDPMFASLKTYLFCALAKR